MSCLPKKYKLIELVADFLGGSELIPFDVYKSAIWFENVPVFVQFLLVDFHVSEQQRSMCIIQLLEIKKIVFVFVPFDLQSSRNHALFMWRRYGTGSNPSHAWSVSVPRATLV